MSARQCVELAGRCGGKSLALEGDGQVRCLTHATDPVRIRRREERNLRGGLGALRTLPKGTRLPPFPKTLEAIGPWSKAMVGLVLRGQLDAKLSQEARGHVATALLQPRAILAQERIAEALLRLEHGGDAVRLLARLTDSLNDPSRRRPLPERKGLALTEGERAS